MQLLRVRMVDVPDTRGLLCYQALAAHHGLSLDVVAGSKEMATLRASGTEEGMVEGDVPQALVRGTSQAWR